MLLRSFKLRFADGHVRIVPRTDAAGCPFSGPGVDLRGEAAAEALALGEPLVAVLRELAPDVCVRSLAVDLERPRVTATLDPPAAPGAPAAALGARAHVVRLDEGAVLQRLLEASGPLCERLVCAAEAAIARRPPDSSPGKKSRQSEDSPCDTPQRWSEIGPTPQSSGIAACSRTSSRSST